MDLLHPENDFAKTLSSRTTESLLALLQRPIWDNMPATFAAACDQIKAMARDELIKRGVLVKEKDDD